MPIELKMPALSPTMEEGTLAKWLVKEGDTVKSGDILAEIETDKATMEFEAVDEGTIARSSSRKAPMDGTELCYRLCTESHHHHLVCSSCHRVVEVERCRARQLARHGHGAARLRRHRPSCRDHRPLPVLPLHAGSQPSRYAVGSRSIRSN